MEDLFNEYVHIARLALEGKPNDVLAHIKRNIRQITKVRPEIGETLKQIIIEHSDLANATRANSDLPLPIDIDSKLELLKREFSFFEKDPIWPSNVSNELITIIEERKHESELVNMGLAPTRSILFIGPPGVGKTLAAKWLSYKLKKPLLTLDLAAVMSSFLGRTGNNIRAVLNYAQKTPSLLLLDEFDAVAKRRNDDSEVGELKRLVTVLLQSVDEWPSKGLLLAATNHPDLLDPAVWRRFERVIQFPNPSEKEIEQTLYDLLPIEKTKKIQELLKILAFAFEGESYAEVVRQINLVRRESIVRKMDLEEALINLLIGVCNKLKRDEKKELAIKLVSWGLTQRKASEITGISRDTIRKYLKENDG